MVFLPIRVMLHCAAPNRGEWPRFMRIKQQFLTSEGRAPRPRPDLTSAV